MVAIAKAPLRRAKLPPARVPPLANGDRLTAAEFMRRYESTQEDFKAELINGITYVMMPAHFEGHGVADSITNLWLGHYAWKTTGVQHAQNVTTKLSRFDIPQPDGVLLWKAEKGGQTRRTPDDYLEGAPELVVEVAASSSNYDMHDKRDAYLRAGVKEYIVVRTWDKAVSWFILEDDQYIELQPDKKGVCRSQVFPGLWLNVPALIALDRAGVLNTLEAGLADRKKRRG